MAQSTPTRVDMALCLFSGQVSVGTSSQRLVDFSIHINHYIVLQTEVTNSFPIFIGQPGVTATDGFPLAPGAQLKLFINDIYHIGVIALSEGDIITYIGS